jgi:SsrA-binding protein
MASKSKSGRPQVREPSIENRRARHQYHISETLECGLKLTGTEIKSLRVGQISIAEGFARASDSPVALTLYGVHIAEYPPAGSHRQHAPNRPRTLLAHRREIRKLADMTRQAGTTLVPIKVYFVRGRAKLLLGVARGKRKADKRQDLSKAEAKKEIDRALRR